MPLTPFHWSILVFGFLLMDLFYIPVLAVSSVLMDIEPFYHMFISPAADGTLHGFFHTYLGATVLALVVGFMFVAQRKPIDKIMARFKLNQTKISVKSIYSSSLLAAYSHIFLDSLMHSDLVPFWPFTHLNPFLGLIPAGSIYLITGVGLLLSGMVYLLILLENR